MKEDAFYLERARGDHESFADTKRSRYVFLLFFFGLWFFFLSAVREADGRELGGNGCVVWK